MYVSFTQPSEFGAAVEASDERGSDEDDGRKNDGGADASACKKPGAVADRFDNFFYHVLAGAFKPEPSYKSHSEAEEEKGRLP